MNAPRIGAWVAVVIASVEALNGAAMIATPMRWFNTTPGVTETGPFNKHLVMDVGLVYLVSAVGLAAAAFLRDRRLGLLAAAWPALHALFHLEEWALHGVPKGTAFWTELVGVITMSVLGVLAAAALPARRDETA